MNKIFNKKSTSSENKKNFQTQRYKIKRDITKKSIYIKKINEIR